MAAGKVTRKVVNAAPDSTPETWRLWLSCGHQHTMPMRYPRGARVRVRGKRAPDGKRGPSSYTITGPPRPAPVRRYCETCRNGAVLIPGQTDALEALGVTT
jgi:hypothetical protein